MKAKVKELKLSAFDRMEQFTRMKPEMLGHCGHKTVEAALLYTVNEATKAVKREQDKFFKKWPD
jgi:hypothetical protein